MILTFSNIWVYFFGAVEAAAAAGGGGFAAFWASAMAAFR